MTYLRVDCYVCNANWNYYQEKIFYPPILTTAVDIQGTVCPYCGSIGTIPSKVNCKTEWEAKNETKPTG